MLQGLICSMIQQQQQQPPEIVMDESLSNLSCAFGEASPSNSSVNPSVGESSAYEQQNLHQNDPSSNQPPTNKRKRNLPGNPDPDAEVIALSPTSLLATNRFMCEICNKGFQRDQNLQLHRRGHNLPWKLKQRSNKEVARKKVYVCPESSCVHHHPSRALGDLTGIKKHFCRKHGEKRWKCDKCSKRYAVQSDWKAHSKICGTREYRCDCGTLFSRRDSFITHRAFCHALAEETARSVTPNPLVILPTAGQTNQAALQAAAAHNQSSGSVSHQLQQQQHHLFMNLQNPQLMNTHSPFSIKQEKEQHQHETQLEQSFNLIPPWSSSSSTMMFSQELMQTLGVHNHQPHRNPSHGNAIASGGSTSFSTALQPPHPPISATALLQKAAQFGVSMSSQSAEITGTPQQGHVTTAAAFGSFNHGAGVSGGGSPSLLLHDIMMMSSLSFNSFEDGGGGDDLTRDFLGLRPLSHTEMLNIAGLSDSAIASNASSSSTSQHEDQSHATCQG